MPKIVSIQFATAGKLYYFNAGTLDLQQGDNVVVETERGSSIGQVTKNPVERNENLPRNLVTVNRIATADDFAIRDQIIAKEKEAFNFCLTRIVERNMEMKLVKVEYQFDCSKAVFFFTADGRVDFRDLVKDLAHTFHTRIEMRQIGVRDEAKMIGGIGICGRELCCCSFLREFQPVSVKMAKEQNLALNPNKISGQCGRLLCCLDYEYETYCCLRKSAPKCGKRICTAEVNGTIDKVNILTGDITLRLDDNKLIVVKRAEVLGDAPPAEQKTTLVNDKSEASKPTVQRERRPQRPQQSNQAQRDREAERKLAAENKISSETATIKIAATPVIPATTLVAIEEKAPDKKIVEGEKRPPKKRNRNRRHGHRKLEDKPQPSDENE